MSRRTICGQSKQSGNVLRTGFVDENTNKKNGAVMDTV